MRPAAHALETGPMNVGVWLPGEIADAFRRHVPKKKRSEYGKGAIEMRLRTEGAFSAGAGDKAAEVLKTIPADALPLVAKFAELLGARGTAAVEAKLDELVADEIATATTQ